MLAPVLVLCCCGGVAGVPVAWFFRQTVEAGKGAPDPAAAADSYLLALGYDNQDGLLPLLDKAHRQDLLRQWRDFRAAMDRTTPRPSRLDYGPLTSSLDGRGLVHVTAAVSVTWWGTDGGSSGGFRSQQHDWSFQTRDDNGWRIVSVDQPAWCGTGGYVSQCGPIAPSPTVTPSSPTASPSEDMLEAPRQMLPCGPADPFRDMHSCPPLTPSPSRMPSGTPRPTPSMS